MLGTFSKLVFLGAAQRRVLEQGVPVFTWHKLGPVPGTSRDPYLYQSASEFDAQLGALRRAGYHSGSLDDLFSAAQIERIAVLTFDDAFGNVLTNGLSILAKHKFQAIQFAVAGRLGQFNDWDTAKGDMGERLMDKEQLREWLAAGNKLGSHSMTHKNLRHCTPAELQTEVVDSKKKLEDEFGIAIDHFCYPYGSYNPAVRDAVAAGGYRTACTVEFGVNDSRTCRHEIRRIIPLFERAVAGKICHRLMRKLRS